MILNNVEPDPIEGDDDADDITNYDLEEDDEVETSEKGNLSFDEDKDSYELDVKSDDPEYDHSDPYNSAVKDGGDFDSTYDEQNPLAVDEYIPNETLETDVDSLGMHVESADSLETDTVDKILAHTPEDDRDDLDEEGYPKNDMPKPI